MIQLARFNIIMGMLCLLLTLYATDTAAIMLLLFGSLCNFSSALIIFYKEGKARING